MQCQCSCRAVSAASARKLYRARAGDRPRAGIVQCHLRHIYGLWAYNFFKFVKLLAKPNRRGRGAHESLRKSHSRLLPPHGGLTEAARKGGYGQDTGSVHPSQAKCELGINTQITLIHMTHNSTSMQKIQSTVNRGDFRHPPKKYIVYFIFSYHLHFPRIFSYDLLRQYINIINTIICLYNILSDMFFVYFSEIH